MTSNIREIRPKTIIYNCYSSDRLCNFVCTRPPNKALMGYQYAIYNDDCGCDMYLLFFPLLEYCQKHSQDWHYEILEELTDATTIKILGHINRHVRMLKACNSYPAPPETDKYRYDVCFDGYRRIRK